MNNISKDSSELASDITPRIVGVEMTAKDTLMRLSNVVKNERAHRIVSLPYDELDEAPLMEMSIPFQEDPRSQVLNLVQGLAKTDGPQQRYDLLLYRTKIKKVVATLIYHEEHPRAPSKNQNILALEHLPLLKADAKTRTLFDEGQIAMMKFGDYRKEPATGEGAVRLVGIQNATPHEAIGKFIQGARRHFKRELYYDIWLCPVPFTTDPENTKLIEGEGSAAVLMFSDERS